MTSRLRRKLRTTARAAWSALRRTGTSLAAAAALLAAGADATAGSTPPALPPVLPVAFQPPPPTGREARGGEDDLAEIFFYFDLPGPERLFRLESESVMQLRMQNEAKSRRRGIRLQFPKETYRVTEVYAGRYWPPQTFAAEPHFVNYRRLYFQQNNPERYGWDFGILSPVGEALGFYGDVALLPYHAFTDVHRKFDSSAGYCLPGDPVPYYLYPHELSATGAAAQLATIGALIAIFP